MAGCRTGPAARAAEPAAPSRYTRPMHDLLLHACCGPCSTVAVPAWRGRGVEPLAWFHNPNIQPAAELERRLESMRRFSRAAGLELVVETRAQHCRPLTPGRRLLGAAAPEERCTVCLGLRLRQAAAAQD